MSIPWLVLVLASDVVSFGFDASSQEASCGRRLKSPRALRPPCDLSLEAFCAKAGSAYPWTAVRHFVRENQGLMRRMYGDQLQRSVIEAELFTNDIPDDDDSDDFFRYSKDLELDNELEESSSSSAARVLHHDDEESKIADVMNTEFVFPEKSVKYGDLMGNKTKVTTERVNKTESENLTVTDSYNTTFYFYEIDQTQNVTENSTERTTTTTTTVGTTDAVTDTTVNVDETTTEAEKKKTSTSTMLFQDANQKKVYSFKGQGVNACPVKQEVVAPYWANNTRGQVLALINIYPFEQYIHCEVCTSRHRQMHCRDGCRCEQQYRVHRLLAYDPNNECRGVFADWFKFPSCCVCRCYFAGGDGGRVTARSPRQQQQRDGYAMPGWFKKRKVQEEEELSND